MKWRMLSLMPIRYQSIRLERRIFKSAAIQTEEILGHNELGNVTGFVNIKRDHDSYIDSQKLAR